MRVSVRELNSHLSQYLHQVKAGETLIVTSHHKPLVKIEAVPTTQVSGLQDLVHLEGVRWNGKKPQGGGKDCPTISGATGSDYVLEDRG